MDTKLKTIKCSTGIPQLIVDPSDLHATIFILGAGFTRGYNENLVPLTTDVLAIAEKTTKLKPEHEHKMLIDFIKKYFHDYQSVNIEKLATFLKSSFPPTHESAREPREMYLKQIIDLIINTLSNIYENPQSDQIKNLYNKFADELVKNQSKVITFNYDTLLDTFLRNTRRWSVVNGYGVKMELDFNPHYDLAITELDNLKKELKQAKHEGSATLLKLHGSINWCKPIVEDPYKKLAIVVSSFGLSVFLDSQSDWSNKGIGPANMASHPPYGNTPNLIYEPFIVPPILVKEDLVREPLLQNVWYHAMESFRHVNNIVIIGYSFPPTDFMVDSTIRQGLSTWVEKLRKSQRKVWCINKNINEQYILRVKEIFKNCEIEFLNIDTVDFLNQWLN